MKISKPNHCAFILVFAALTVGPVLSQQPTLTEKQTLVLTFRQLTGADRVNLALNVSFEDTKDDLIATVDGDPDLTDSQKKELRKSAIEAYNRLDEHLRAFLNDTATITPLSEGAVYQVYDRVFDETELKELIAFYSTKTGQKALQFLPTLSEQFQKAFRSILIPRLQEFITPLIKAEEEQLKQKIGDAKTESPS